MAKRATTPEPVTETEITAAVLRTIAEAFGDRPLAPGVARRGLALAAFELIQLELREVARDGGRPDRRTPRQAKARR